jgi:hypothetical protein
MKKIENRGFEIELISILRPRFPPTKTARMAELVDALVSNTCGKPCRFDSGSGYEEGCQFLAAFFICVQ